jgi:hypothetical protein
MSDPNETYERWMDNIQAELEAYEGHGPPDDEQLVGVARRETGGALGVIENIEAGDGEFLEENLETLKGDILKIRVALEMVGGYR